jgi:hypothetical protein
MSRARFTTARSLFETFPELAGKSGMSPTDEPPTVFLAALSTRRQYENAVAFCAHLLPRREAVWWACGSVRTLLGDLQRPRPEGLLAAEGWVHEPNDRNRMLALHLGAAGDDSDPSTWLALAAGWSGGLLTTPPSPPVLVPPYMTPRATRIAIMLSARHLSAAERSDRLRACIADGLTLAEPKTENSSGTGNQTARDKTSGLDGV